MPIELRVRGGAVRYSRIGRRGRSAAVDLFVNRHHAAEGAEIDAMRNSCTMDSPTISGCSLRIGSAPRDPLRALPLSVPWLPPGSGGLLEGRRPGRPSVVLDQSNWPRTAPQEIAPLHSPSHLRAGLRPKS